MIDFDTTRLPMGSAEWTALLDAVYAAAPEDESEWIEWKSRLDLHTKAGVATLAKAIVAFANRLPVVAQQWLEGRGLVLVGMQPGDVPGVTPRDPADLDTALHNLLGPTGPRFELRWCTYRDAQVLIVEVAAPQDGDPIHVIAKSSDSVTDGDIYVRRPGRSSKATSADISALTARLSAAPSAGLDIDVLVDVGPGLPRLGDPYPHIDEWVHRERGWLMEPCLAAHRPARLEDYRDPLSSVRLSALAQIPRFGRLEEDRSKEQYESEVEEYLNACRDALPQAAIAAAIHLSNPIKVRVRNRTDQNFEHLQVHLHVEGEVVGFEPSEGSSNPRGFLPKRPRRWGPKEPTLAVPRAFLNPPPTAYAPHTPVLRPEIRNGGSTDLELLSFHLRPFATEVASEDEIVLLTPEAEASVLRATWSATATNVPGRAEGVVEIPLLDGHLDIGSVLEWREPGGKPIRPGRD